MSRVRIKATLPALVEPVRRGHPDGVGPESDESRSRRLSFDILLSKYEAPVKSLYSLSLFLRLLKLVRNERFPMHPKINGRLEGACSDFDQNGRRGKPLIIHETIEIQALEEIPSRCAILNPSNCVEL